MDVSEAKIEVEPDVGLQVKIEGVAENGDIVAKEVEIDGVETQGEEAKVTLEDRVWVLGKYGDPNNLIDVLEGTEITVELVSAEGKMQGSAGCNSYFGSYEAEGGQLSIPGQIGAMEMYCMEPEGIMEQEQEYLAMLQNAGTYEIEDYQLQIFSGDKVLIFER